MTEQKKCNKCGEYKPIANGLLCSDCWALLESTPPKQDELVGVEIKCPRCDGFKAISEGCFGSSPCPMCEATGTIFSEVTPTQLHSLGYYKLDRELFKKTLKTFLTSDYRLDEIVDLLLNPKSEIKKEGE